MLASLLQQAAWVYALAIWVGAGALLGALLGPVGWWLVWRTPGAFDECGACSRPVRVQARTCPHCGASRMRPLGRSTRSQLKGVERARGPW